MKLSELLYALEFDHIINDDNYLCLVDLLGANLGKIEQEEFEISKNLASNLIDRLDNYVYDYFVNGFIETLKHECHEDVKTNYFPDILKQMQKHKDKFKDCIEFMEVLVYPEILDISDIYYNKSITARCPKCNSRLKKSVVDGYAFTCQKCDEDFYSFEVDTDIDPNDIIVRCYDKETKYKDRKQALDFYMGCMMCSEGSEQCRYSNIVAQLYSGKMYCCDED